jgi:hypothetical protein
MHKIDVGVCAEVFDGAVTIVYDADKTTEDAIIKALKKNQLHRPQSFGRRKS